MEFLLPYKNNCILDQQKEAENALAKRLREVNDEVKKSDARSGTVSKDLENTVQALRSEEAKSAELVNRIKSLEQRDKDVGSLSAQLQESANRVAEFQALHAQAKNQLKEAEEKHALKDKEIQVRGHFYYFCGWSAFLLGDPACLTARTNPRLTSYNAQAR